MVPLFIILHRSGAAMNLRSPEASLLCPYISPPVFCAPSYGTSIVYFAIARRLDSGTCWKIFTVTSSTSRVDPNFLVFSKHSVLHWLLRTHQPVNQVRHGQLEQRIFIQNAIEIATTVAIAAECSSDRRTAACIVYRYLLTFSRHNRTATPVNPGALTSAANAPAGSTNGSVAHPVHPPFL